MVITAIKRNICKIKCVYFVQVFLVELANFNSIFSEDVLKRQKLRAWKIPVKWSSGKRELLIERRAMLQSPEISLVYLRKNQKLCEWMSML